MAFSFGLGSDTMLSQVQRDATQFKLVDIATNIQKYSAQVGQASAYVDYTFRHLNRFMQQDQENDDHSTFLLEYQALLRSRIQQLITDLTSALTRDLDTSIEQTRPSIWNDPAAAGSSRSSGQGYTSDVEDAGGARMAYNFFTGFANVATPSQNSLTSYAYYGIPTYDSRFGTEIHKVAIDSQADASFSAYNPVTNGTQSFVRAIGTAVLQQSFPEDGLTEAVVDNLRIRHQGNAVTYNEVGGGFIDAKNTYKFINTSGANKFDTQNIFFYNTTVGAAGSDTGNKNDDAWDGTKAITDQYLQFNRYNNAKNNFEKILYDTIYELDQRNLLRDIMRLSEKDGLLNDIQIATTTSISTGTQTSASVKLNFIPNETGPVTDNTATTVTVFSNANFFQVGDIVQLTIQASPEETITRQITGISGNVLTFASPPNAPLPVPVIGPPRTGGIIQNSTVKTTREDLGGRIQIVMDHYTAFFHS